MRAAVLYATREGQTRRVAARIADDLRLRGVEVDLLDVGVAGSIDWSRYQAACLAASVHIGHHEPEMIALVKEHRAELERLGASFISVTLSEAGVEDPRRTDAVRKQAMADVRQMLNTFVAETGWRPARMFPVAGALTYSKYNIFVRFIMKRIARKQGAPTDTSRDYEFTDWQAVDGFAREFAERVR
jgi:menaquinone-dependent protoporphyrinogen oxidase